MAALAADRDTHRKEIGLFNYPVAASTTIYKGGMVALDTDGFLVPASDTADLIVVGWAAEYVDNSGGSDGDEDCEVREGIARFAATSITAAMRGTLMYVVDDQTFDETDPGNSVVAGILVGYEDTDDGWLQISPVIGAQIELTLTALGVTASAAEINVLDGVTAGTVTASKGVVVDSNKDIGDFRNLDAVNIDAGASGTAGSVDVFPTTASKGKFSLACTDQTGDTTVTLNANAMGQGTTVNIPDPGAAAAYVALSTAALTIAEVDVLDGVTPGTLAASKALVADASSNLDAVNATDFDAGASGTAGSVDVFPTTASKGKFSLACTDQTGDTTVTLNANAMGQATTVNIPDPGAAATYMVLSAAAHGHLLQGSDTWDPGSLNDGTQESKDFTVTGAALGDFAIAGAGIDVTDLIVSAVVTAANTVTITLANETGGAVDLGSSTWNALVIPAA